MTRGIAIVALAITAWTVTQDPQQPPVFRSTGSVVAVDGSVRDVTRRVLTDLTAADFTVLDNGVPQQVEQVSYGRVPIDVTVGLDISRSVDGQPRTCLFVHLD